MSEFDLIIIGTGVAGRTAVEEAVAAGLTTAIVDRREFGGTCALRGCEPKKVLVAAAEGPERVRDQRGSGVFGQAGLEWGELVGFKRTFTDALPEQFEASFLEMGAAPLHGVARFTGPAELEVSGQRYRAGNVLIATGSVPQRLGIEGEDLVIDSERFMELAEMPERVAFVGGGFISFEFAPLVKLAGGAATILHRSARALSGFDPDLVEMLVGGYREAGVDVRFDAPVVAVRRCARGIEVEYGSGEKLECDLVVHGAGRVPDVADLDLAAGGVDFTGRGVDVDDGMRSVSNPAIFAAGDAAANGPALTPVAVAQARIAVRNIVAPGSARFDPQAIASVVFSDPPLASVGLVAAAAARVNPDRQGGVGVGGRAVVRFADTSTWASSRRVGLRRTGAKVLVERDTGVILGAHVLGHNADELINLFSLAISKQVTADEIRSHLWAYPTVTSEIVYLV